MSEIAVYNPNARPMRRSAVAAKLVDGDVWNTLANIAHTVAPTEFVPPGLRNKPESVLACLLYGHDLGLSPMVALREIAMIDGKPALSAALVTARVRQAGHQMEWKQLIADDGEFIGVTAYGQRLDGSKGEYTFTLKMAQRAGLMRANGPYFKYPESMCWARAATQLARMLFSDVFLGHATYMPEELGGEPDEDALSGVVLDDAPSLAAATESGEPQAGAGGIAPSRRPLTSEPSSPDSPASSEGPAGNGPSPNFPIPATDGPNKPCAQFPTGTTQQKTLKKLDVTVVKGRDAGYWTTAAVYEIARMYARQGGHDELVQPDAFYLGDDGKLHWSDLRTIVPLWLASQIIDHLDGLAAGRKAA